MNDEPASAPVVTRVRADPAVAPGFSAQYADAFQVAGVRTATAREWALRSLRGAAANDGRFARIAWHGLLRFDLAPFDSPDAIAGWRIVSDDGQRIVLATSGPLIDGRLVFEATESGVTWTTLLRFPRRAGRRRWRLLGAVHRLIVPRALRRAARG